MFYLLLQKFKVDANSVKFGHGCRKGFDNQHALVSLIERWQKYLDSKGCRDTVLIDLSQAFNAPAWPITSKVSCVWFWYKNIKVTV